jgi:hypothetical protein
MFEPIRGHQHNNVQFFRFHKICHKKKHVLFLHTYGPEIMWQFIRSFLTYDGLLHHSAWWILLPSHDEHILRHVVSMVHFFFLISRIYSVYQKILRSWQISVFWGIFTNFQLPWVRKSGSWDAICLSVSLLCLCMFIFIFNCKWIFTRWQWYYNKTQHK